MAGSGVSPAARCKNAAAAGLAEDPVPHRRIERPGDRRVQQPTCVIGGQPLDREFRQSFELMIVAGLAQREYQSHPLRQKAPCHERKRLHRHPIEPLRVVDDADERLLLGGVGEQAQDGQADQKAIRRGTGAHAERGVQRVALGDWQEPETAKHRCAQRVQAGECELHLGLDPRYPGDPASLRDARQIPQQDGLTDSRLAAEDQHATATRARFHDESIQYLALAVTVEQPHPREVGVRHADEKRVGRGLRNPSRTHPGRDIPGVPNPPP
jgi:hypothetical protein